MRFQNAASRHGSRLPRCLAGVVLCAGVGLAHAQSGYSVHPVGPLTSPAGNGAYLVVSNTTGSTILTPYSRYSVPSSSGALQVLERATVAGPRGNMLIGITSNLSGSTAARLAVRCVIGANPYCLAGSAALALFSMYRMTQNPDGSVTVDQGVSATGTSGNKWGASGSFQCSGTVTVPAVYGSAEEAQFAVVKGYPSSCTTNGASETLVQTFTYGQMVSGGIRVDVRQDRTNKTTGVTTTTSTWTTTLPAASFMPAQTCPNGGSYSVDVGNCSGGPTVTMTADAAADYIAAKIQANQYRSGHATLAKAVDTIAQNTPVAAESVSLEVPATIDGGTVSTSTVTNADGSTSTTTTTRQFQLTSSGNRINVTTKDTATTVNRTSGGATTSTSSQVSTTATPTTGTGDGAPYATPGTATTTPTGSTTATGTGTSTPAKNQCETHPDSVGCAKLGDAPTDEIPKSTASVSYAAESLGLPSGCPAGYTVIGHTLSFQPACDAMGLIRPMILAVAAVMAAMMCIAAVRGN